MNPCAPMACRRVLHGATIAGGLVGVKGQGSGGLNGVSVGGQEQGSQWKRGSGPNRGRLAGLMPLCPDRVRQITRCRLGLYQDEGEYAEPCEHA